MKKKSLIAILIPLVLCLHTHTTQSTILALGNITSLTANIPAQKSLTFTQRVTTKAFDPFTGQLFVGLDSRTQPGPFNTFADPGSFIISKAQRPAGGAIPAFAAIGSLFGTTQFPVDFMALATAPGNQSPIVAIVAQNSTNAQNLDTKNMYALSNTGSILQTSANLLATNPVVGAHGAVTHGIVGLAANNDFAFLAVKPSTNTEFGQAGSGIAVVSIDPVTLMMQQVNAVPGDPGIKAVLFDATISQITTNTNYPTLVENRIALYWDEPLQRLYLGEQLITNTSPGDGARSVVVGHLDINENGELTLEDFLPASALINGQADKIVGAQNDNISTFTLAAAQLKTLHASTGPSYLIVHGGNGTVTTDESVGGGTVGNRIWALPLVDVQDPSNVDQGKLANKNVFNATTHRYETAASVNPQLTNTADPYAAVGGGPLPLQPATPISGVGAGFLQNSVYVGRDTFDIQVVGDTVYVAITTPQTDFDETGVIYSQAMFDEQGKISGWTPWAKRAFPLDAFQDTPRPTSTVHFTTIDPVLDKVWGVDGDLTQAVRITGWQSSPFMTPLPQAAHNALGNGSFSVLDLDQSTTWLANETASRYALFGGVQTVVFARTTEARSAPFANAPQKIITNYSSAQNFLVTRLPENAGCVTCLEYTRQSIAANNNYFLAGTNTGLYAFAGDGGNGFNVTSLSTLDMAPFATNFWQLVTQIPGSVLDIESLGDKVYVLTVERQSGAAPAYKVHSFAPTPAIGGFAPVVIAQSATTNLGSTQAFYGIELIATGATEQLVLATNNGLYQTTTSGGVQLATNQATANWHIIHNNNAMLYNGMAGIDTAAPTTVWPWSLQDPKGFKIFNRGSVFQVSGGGIDIPSGIPNNFTFVPNPFNSNSPAPALKTFTPISYFWSDGGRRMFAIRNESANSSVTNVLMALPYDALQWNISVPMVFGDSALNGVRQFNWFKQIGATGLFLTGTNNGVVALE